MGHRYDRAGFTIMELLIAMVIVAIISGIIYSTFSSVIASTETADIASEQLYTQSFLMRNIQANFTQAQAGWQPGAVFRPVSDPQNTITQVMASSLFLFEGIDNGEEDSVTFTSSAPINGIGGLPGMLKHVTYEIIDGSDIEIQSSSPYGRFSAEGPVLRIREIPLMSYADSLGGDVMSQQMDKLIQNAEELGVAVPTWTFPIGSMDVLYFDGEEWRKNWDMTLEERLPWALDFTFSWRPWGQESSSDLSSDPENQFRMVITLPSGVGIRNAAPAYGRPDNPYQNQPQNGGQAGGRNE